MPRKKTTNKSIFINELNRITNDEKLMNTIKEEFKTQDGKFNKSTTFENEFINKFTDIKMPKSKKSKKQKEISTVSKFIHIWTTIVPDLTKKNEEIFKLAGTMKKFIDNTLYWETKKEEKDRRSTIINYFSVMRKAFTNHFGDKTPEYLEMKPFQATEFSKQINKEAKDKVDARGEEPGIPINLSEIKQTIRKLYNTKSQDERHQDLYIALSLASGLRRVEILDETTTTIREKKNDSNVIRIEGVAKKRNNERFELERPRPLIELNYNEFEKALEEVRSFIKPEGKTRAEITRDIEYKDVNKEINKLFPQFRVKGKSPILRQIYAGYLHDVLHAKAKDRSQIVGKYFSHEGTVPNYNIVDVIDDTKPGYKPTNEQLNDAMSAELQKIKAEHKNIMKEQTEILDKIKKGETKLSASRRRIKEDDAQRFERFKKEAKEMEEKKIPLNHRNIKAKGFGSDYIKELLNKYNQTKNKPALPPRPSAERIKELKAEAESEAEKKE
jgi:hypothetical protein